MTKDKADSLMNELVAKNLREKYPDLPLEVVNDIIAISRDNRDRAKSLKIMRKYLFDYFKSLEECSE